MQLQVQKILLVVVSTLGLAAALDCLTCKWDSKNNTVDHACLGAPYQVKVESCPEPSKPGERYACQTYAVFKTRSGVKALKSLQRSCAMKHSKCNNACLKDINNCWLCCDDQSKCNGFPLRANLDMASSSAPSPWQRMTSATLVILATVWSFRSLLY